MTLASCSWCTRDAFPGCFDEDGDPTCAECARVAGAAPGSHPPRRRRSKATGAPLPFGDALAELVGVDGALLEGVEEPERSQRIETAAEAWLRARGWTTVTVRRAGGRPYLAWRHFGRPRGTYPVSLPRAVVAEHECPSTRAA